MIREYQTGDAAKVKAQAAQAAEVSQCGGFEEITGFSLVDGEDVLAVFGFRADTVAREIDCFALVGQNAGRKLCEMVRFVRKKMPEVMEEQQAKAAVITVKVGFKAGERMAEMLGFSPVVKLAAFYNGEDYQLFERRV